MIFATTLFAVYPHFYLVDAAVEEAATESAVSADEEYQLPYPGILPDNPLYPIKAFRDKIVSFLISDPLKKADYNLLQADKRLQSGVLLIEKSKKYQLAIDTISKGENYFEEAILKAADAKKQGLDAGKIQGKLRQALKKHHEIVAALVKKAPKEFSPGFKILIKRIEVLSEKVRELSL